MAHVRFRSVIWLLLIFPAWPTLSAAYVLSQPCTNLLCTRNSFLGWDVRLTYFEALALIENGEREAPLLCQWRSSDPFEEEKEAAEEAISWDSKPIQIRCVKEWWQTRPIAG